MLHRRAFAGVALAALLVGGGVAAAQDTVKIGVITDHSGPSKFYAELATEGVQLAAKEINAKGGVLGKQIELLIEDDQGKPDVSATKARKLVDEGVVVFVSNSSSTATQQAETVSLETKTPQLAPANGGDTLTTQLDDPWFFQTGPLASDQLLTLLAYAKTKHIAKVAVVGDNAALSQSIADSFKDGLRKAGIAVVADEVIPAGATSAVPNLQKVRAANPDAIFQAGILGPVMLQFFQAYNQLGMKQPILGSYNLGVPAYLTMAKDLMEGVVFVDGIDPEKPQYKAFAAAFRKEYGVDGASTQAYGYDGMYLLADAIGRAGALDKEKIRAAIQATTGFVGAIGAKGSSWGFRDGKRTGFDPDGAAVRVITDNKQGPVVHFGRS